MAGSPARRARREAAGLPVAPRGDKPPQGTGHDANVAPYNMDRRLTDAELATETTSAILNWAAMRRHELIAALDRGLNSDNDVVAARLALSVAQFVAKTAPAEPEPVAVEATVTAHIDSE